MNTGDKIYSYTDIIYDKLSSLIKETVFGAKLPDDKNAELCSFFSCL